MGRAVIIYSFPSIKDGVMSYSPVGGSLVGAWQNLLRLVSIKCYVLSPRAGNFTVK